MDSKTLIKALKTAVREVIKEELTEILRDGLQDTINEMTQPSKKNNVDPKKVIHTPNKMTNENIKKPKIQFSENKWASILNETEAMQESAPAPMNSFSELMNEGIEDIQMNSSDANGFGMMRKNMKESIRATSIAPAVMEDPETGKVYNVDASVAQAMTRDYSSLMKAINKKKGI